jgi:selenide,water dikinase
MARASQVALVLEASALPLLPGIETLAQDDSFVPGGGLRNEANMAGFVTLPDDLLIHLRYILFDPQTSGGLLMAVGADYLESLRRELVARDVAASVIGRVTEGQPHITVVR